MPEPIQEGTRRQGALETRGESVESWEGKGTGVKTRKQDATIGSREVRDTYYCKGLRRSGDGPWEALSFIPTGLISVSGNTCAGSPVGTASSQQQYSPT